MRLRATGAPPSLFSSPYLCVWLFRVSHFLHHKGRIRIARLIWQVNLFVTGADIHPTADFGPGLLILHPVGVTLVGAAGKNLTVMALAGLGGELGRREDVGGGRGVPVLGNDVYLAPAAGVLGPVTIGHRVVFSAGCIVTRDVADDETVHGPDPSIEPSPQAARP